MYDFIASLDVDDFPVNFLKVNIARPGVESIELEVLEFQVNGDMNLEQKWVRFRSQCYET